MSYEKQQRKQTNIHKFGWLKDSVMRAKTALSEFEKETLCVK